jgi:hypothetical protein
LEKAREGLVTVLNSGLVPAPMMITIKDYLTKIDKILGPPAKSLDSEK